MKVRPQPNFQPQNNKIPCFQCGKIISVHRNTTKKRCEECKEKNKKEYQRTYQKKYRMRKGKAKELKIPNPSEDYDDYRGLDEEYLSKIFPKSPEIKLSDYPFILSKNPDILKS